MEAQPNSARKIPVAAILVGLVIVAALGLRLRDMWIARHPLLAEIVLRDKTFTVEIADTETKKEKGLGGRDALAVDHGMYFPFASANHWVFWMKDMRFPIDIVWVRDGKIVHIDASAPVSKNENLETYSPIEPADAVLELNAGVTQALGARPGDELILKMLP